MRNIFDQYSQPENRLTHALVSVLDHDRTLLKQFVRWVTLKTPPKSLSIIEQQLPGEPQISEEESERRGLPDAWIFDDEYWSLLVESKISSPLNNDQLRRHYNAAIKRGYQEILVLAIDVTKPTRKLPDYVLFKTWSEIYTWLYKHASLSTWAAEATRYMEVAESKMVNDGYLKEGTLTVFSGIPFSNDNPYNYPEAKRLIKLAMDELRGRKSLIKQLGMNPKGIGRGAITGKDGGAVWDFLRLKGSSNEEAFTKYPHLTMGIGRDRVLAIVTVPHGIRTEFRRNIIDLEFDGFEDLMRLVNKNLVKSLRKAKGSAPWVDVVQRRYPSQRSAAIVDARVEYDLRTAFPGNTKHPVKTQPEWLMATYDALSNKKSNLQVAVGAIFPYRSCAKTATPEILDYVEATWIACKPLIDIMVKGEY
ncbi:hypothetical protein [Thiohalophilus sp.]|uniref:hypothetical protein n=1 Tax=Thiohalophilus sp. TaxID=3028392 RepID=UPI002ACEB39B|nr:hypothetical protein [Thiohalophilus sp.]MDZ7663005.1 hypothetical protein [Thiohalophilus sp.]